MDSQKHSHKFSLFSPLSKGSNILLSEQCFKKSTPQINLDTVVVRLGFKQIDDSIHAWILLLMLAPAFVSSFSPSSYSKSSLKAQWMG